MSNHPPRVIVSSMGTSLLTGQLTVQASPGELKTLRDAANLTEGTIPAEVAELIERCKTKAIAALKEFDTKKIRAASAELNGIYGIYADDLNFANPRDVHLLVTTDTAQGRATAEILRAHLHRHGINDCRILTPSKLRTSHPDDFINGIKDLLHDFDEFGFAGYEALGFRIIFNLTGGFKSIQGFLNTIAMFYAHEIVYIFDGEGSPLIHIPRLPIQLDDAAFRQHAVELAMMVHGDIRSRGTMPSVPDLAFEVDQNGDATLSAWGLLIWNKIKSSIFTTALLDFPRLTYSEKFKKDFAKAQEKERIHLQETLAKIAAKIRDNGDTAPLKRDGGLQYDNYVNQLDGNEPIGHFRVGQAWRVSCTSKQGTLQLRRFGSEPTVNDNP